MLLAEELGRVDGWVCFSVVAIGGLLMLAWFANAAWDRYLTHQQRLAEIEASKHKKGKAQG